MLTKVVFLLNAELLAAFIMYSQPSRLHSCRKPLLFHILAECKREDGSPPGSRLSQYELFGLQWSFNVFSRSWVTVLGLQLSNDLPVFFVFCFKKSDLARRNPAQCKINVHPHPSIGRLLAQVALPGVTSTACKCLPIKSMLSARIAVCSLSLVSETDGGC